MKVEVWVVSLVWVGWSGFSARGNIVGSAALEKSEAWWMCSMMLVKELCEVDDAVLWEISYVMRNKGGAVLW